MSRSFPSIAPESISLTSVEEADVLLPERHQQQHQMLAHLRADLADHAEVEQVQALLVGCHIRLPGCGSAWKNPSTRICL